MLGLMHDHPYVFTPTIAKIMLPVWVCLLVSTVRAIRRDMKKEKAGDLSKEETDERDRKSTRLNSSHIIPSRMPSSA